MYRSVFLVLLVITGCAVIGAAPAQWVIDLTPVQTESLVLQEALRNFSQVPTRLRDVQRIPGGYITKFLLGPNEYQTCGCRVNGDIIVCVCNHPEFGLCPEFEL
ncbi:hypothetical protein LCGC14_1683510 [marine sediment metagenome]|uniref:Uncharacterized protein n=1 Tax=marine sediment metagenome TaxID=412755 RepID=A0A0F9KMX7_9ZZZZ